MAACVGFPAVRAAGLGPHVLVIAQTFPRGDLHTDLCLFGALAAGHRTSAAEEAATHLWTRTAVAVIVGSQRVAEAYTDALQQSEKIVVCQIAREEEMVCCAADVGDLVCGFCCSCVLCRYVMVGVTASLGRAKYAFANCVCH